MSSDVFYFLYKRTYTDEGNCGPFLWEVKFTVGLQLVYLFLLWFVICHGHSSVREVDRTPGFLHCIFYWKWRKNMLFYHVLIMTLCSSSPLLDVTDIIPKGGTAVYTVSLEEETVYWLTLRSEGGVTDLNVAASSNEMDFEQFMNLPYREDFLYALEYAIATGLSAGDESVTLPADYSGPVYIVVHDIGGGGGSFTLTIQ